MPSSQHAVDLLAKAKWPAVPGVCVLYGDEPYLKQLMIQRLRDAVLGAEDDFGETIVDGRTAQLADVMDALATRSLFGGGTRRLVLVEAADEFVRRHRTELEDYVSAPRSSGVLVLDVSRWPSNTRLYKSIDKSGLQIDCSPPTAAKLRKWLIERAKQAQRARLGPEEADLLLETIGPEIGLLDQELAKLATCAGEDQAITAQLIGELVAGGRAKTAWEMLDAALAGQTATALAQLDRLLLAGENEIALLAQISSSLRRFGHGCRLIEQAEASGRRLAPRAALEQAGVRGFVLGKAETQLRKLGRQRARRLLRWLLEADLDLKGGSELPARAVLERLLVRLAVPPAEPRHVKGARVAS